MAAFIDLELQWAEHMPGSSIDAVAQRIVEVSLS